MDRGVDPSSLYRDGARVGRISGIDVDDSCDDNRYDVGTLVDSDLRHRFDHRYDDDRSDDQYSGYLLTIAQSATVQGRAGSSQSCQRVGRPLDVGDVGTVGYGELSLRAALYSGIVGIG